MSVNSPNRSGKCDGSVRIVWCSRVERRHAQSHYEHNHGGLCTTASLPAGRHVAVVVSALSTATGALDDACVVHIVVQ